MHATQFTVFWHLGWHYTKVVYVFLNNIKLHYRDWPTKNCNSKEVNLNR